MGWKNGYEEGLQESGNFPFYLPGLFQGQEGACCWNEGWRPRIACWVRLVTVRQAFKGAGLQCGVTVGGGKAGGKEASEKAPPAACL